MQKNGPPVGQIHIVQRPKSTLWAQPPSSEHGAKTPVQSPSQVLKMVIAFAAAPVTSRLESSIVPAGFSGRRLRSSSLSPARYSSSFQALMTANLDMLVIPFCGEF